MCENRVKDGNTRQTANTEIDDGAKRLEFIYSRASRPIVSDKGMVAYFRRDVNSHWFQAKRTKNEARSIVLIPKSLFHCMASCEKQNCC